MQKVKQTKRQRKAKRRNFAWMQIKGASDLYAYSVAGAGYKGSLSDWLGGKNVPFIRIG